VATLEQLFPSPYVKTLRHTPRPRADELDGRGDRERHASLWGEWVDREEDFFHRCAVLVSTLTWRKIVRIIGPEGAIAMRLVRDADREVTTSSVPERARVVHLRVVSVDGAGGCQVAAPYTTFHQLALPLTTARSLTRSRSARGSATAACSRSPGPSDAQRLPRRWKKCAAKLRITRSPACACYASTTTAKSSTACAHC
jgi:hypothetical protein